VGSAIAIVVGVLSGLIGLIGLQFRRRRALEAEVLFLRRQLALYVERRVKPRRVDAATREAVGYQDEHKFLLHDRDSIFTSDLDESIRKLGTRVLKSPPRCPKANAICERVIGTIRRECLDWLIPLSECHLRSILKSWITHYNGGHPHMALGPGVPDPPATPLQSVDLKSRHRLPDGIAICGKPMLGGLHHGYFLAPVAA
jgi:hypothetical protein